MEILSDDEIEKIVLKYCFEDGLRSIHIMTHAIKEALELNNDIIITRLHECFKKKNIDLPLTDKVFYE